MSKRTAAKKTAAPVMVNGYPRTMVRETRAMLADMIGSEGWERVTLEMLSHWLGGFDTAEECAEHFLAQGMDADILLEVSGANDE